MISNETIITGASPVCTGCNIALEPVVIKTSGYSVRTECECGPYSRETEYFKTAEEADEALLVVARLIRMQRTNYAIINRTEAMYELNLKMKDLWTNEEIQEVIDSNSSALIRS